MKKISTLILAGIIAASTITGCSQTRTLTENTSVESSVTSETTEAVVTDASAETTPAEPQSFEELYGEQLMNYLDHQYYFDGAAIPKQESNFYFINAFLDLSGYANMGYYPATTLGYIDLSAEYSGSDYETFGDYFIKYAENSIESTCVLCKRAAEANITLSDDTRKAIDDMMESIKTGNAANTGKSLDEYLQFYYGPGNDEANFRKVLERYYIADAYSSNFCDNYEFAEEELKVPYVRYALFYAPDTAEQEIKDKALEAANSMKDSCSSIDDLTGLAQAAQEAGNVYDQGDIAVPKGQMVPKFEEWAYGDGRTAGELDVIFAPEYGYFVVGYLGLKEQEQDALDQIAMNVLGQSVLDEIDAGTHDFHTDDVYLPAPAAPTATPVPEISLPSEDSSSDPTAATSAATTQTPSGSQTDPSQSADVLIVVFITLAAVAIVAVIVILVVYAFRNGKPNDSSSSGKSFEDSKDESSKKSPGKVRKAKLDEDDLDDDLKDEDSDEE